MNKDGSKKTLQFCGPTLCKPPMLTRQWQRGGGANRGVGGGFLPLATDTEFYNSPKVGHESHDTSQQIIDL